MASVVRPQGRLDTSIDRAGLALAAGSALGGVLILVLLVAGGQRSPMALAAGWVLGSLFSGIAITAVAGPLWLVFHVAGLRRARHAALVAGITALGLFTGAQTYGFGALGLPPMDSRTWMMRWISALGTSALIALIAAGIGLVMWRIAYRARD